MVEITKREDGVLVRCNGEFDPAQTVFCGQCFRWEDLGNDTVCGVVQGHAQTIYYDREEDTALFLDCSTELFEQLWHDYFDFGTDYSAIRARISKNSPIAEKAAAFAPGIRILKQEPWEALCSFILSQNSNIPRIRGMLARLCEHFGEKTADGFVFPTVERLAQCTPEDLAPVRAGFRARYLCSAAQLVSSGVVDLEAARMMELSEARAHLMQICGVGKKVADCTLLYGLHRMECFPVDVWMKRVLERWFPGEDGGRFGEDAGVAQQYLFHYSRSHPESLA